MKAVRFHQYGGPNVVRYEDVDIPTPGSSEVRLRVAGSAFRRMSPKFSPSPAITG